MLDTQFTDAYEELTPDDKQLVLMHVDGMPYRLMAEVLAINGKVMTEGTIKNCFDKNGRLYNAYQLKTKEKEERIAEFHKTAGDLLIDISYKALQNVKKAIDDGKVGVSLDILDRVGLAKVLKVEVADNPLITLLRKNIEAYERDNKIPFQAEQSAIDADTKAE